jgi:dTDP-4-dehydrorhamnose reductase
VRYAILGAQGQLGQELCRHLVGDIHALPRAQADLTEPTPLRHALVDIEPDVVINCAAYNFVDRAEQEPQAALAVNALGVRDLAAVCADLGCILVHFSTDHVFGLDTGRQTPYQESDLPGPVSTYGVSKLAGEYFARSWRRHFVIRTCGLYGLWGRGGKGANFVEKILAKAQRGESLRVVADQRCTPTSTADLARAVAGLVATQRFGLYHLTNAGSCTWFEFARAIVELSGLSTPVQPVSSDEFPSAARRPGYSVLATATLPDLTVPPLGSWRDALTAYLHARQGAA